MSKARTLKQNKATLAREKAGYTRAVAARKLGISEAYLRRIELHGQCPPRRARAIARLYGCSHYLFLFAR